MGHLETIRTTRRTDGSEELLLVEAKANESELKSPGCGAGDKSLTTIKAALNKAKAHLGVPADFPWHETYYQFANRLASLYFLNEMMNISARFLCVYFCGDRFPDGRACPQSPDHWMEPIRRTSERLGLPETHPYTSRVLKVFPNVDQS